MGSILFAVALFFFFTALAAVFFYWVAFQLGGRKAARITAVSTVVFLLVLGVTVLWWVRKIQ